MGVAPPLMERFVVNEITGCWIYRGKKDADGYGRVGSTVAHRVYYESLIGPVPEGMHLDHLCARASCVNPEHLEPVTPAVNQERALAHRGWELGLKPRCSNGHEFTPDNTRIVRARNRRGEWATHRVCRVCHRASKKRYRDKRKTTNK